MPTLLYIDTSGNIATVALSQKGKQLAIRHHENANEQAAVLNNMIASVLAEAGITLQDIDALCVCAGPGSYTGLRVGLSTAKGLCYALDKPILLFNRLDLLAIEFNPNTDFAIVLKARAGEYFYAQYNQVAAITIAPKHALEQDLIDSIDSNPSLKMITDDPDLTLTDNKILIPSPHRISVPTWIPLGEKRFESAEFNDLAYCEPFYLKAAYTTQSKK